MTLRLVLMTTAVALSGYAARSRMIQGNCDSADLDGSELAPGVAEAALAAVRRRGLEPFGADLAYVLITEDVMDEAAANGYMESARSRMAVSSQLYEYLLVYNQSTAIPPRTALEVWSVFQHDNPNHTADTCHTMVVWYRTFCGLKGRNDALAFLFASVVLLDEYFVRLLAVDLVTRASAAVPAIRKRSRPVDEEHISGIQHSPNEFFLRRRNSSPGSFDTYVDMFYHELGVFMAAQCVLRFPEGLVASNAGIQRFVATTLSRPALADHLSHSVLDTMRAATPVKLHDAFDLVVYRRFSAICSFRVNPHQTTVSSSSSSSIAEPIGNPTDIVAFYRSVVDAIRNNDFSREPLTMAQLLPLVPRKVDMLRLIWTRLHKALFLDAETFFDLVEMNRNNAPITANVRSLYGARFLQVITWYNTVLVGNAGKTIAEIGVCLNSFGMTNRNAFLVVPPPALILPLAEADLAEFSKVS